MLQRTNLKQKEVVKILTRTPTIMGIVYPYWAMMLIISTSGIVILKSFSWFAGLFIIMYIVGRIITRYDAFIVNIIIIKLSKCPRIKNYDFWGSNSYDPF